MGMGIKTREWEKITAYCNYSNLCDSFTADRGLQSTSMDTVAPTRWLLYYELLRLEVLLGRTQRPFDGQPSRAPVRCRAGVTCISINLCSPARQCCLVSGHSSAVSQLLRNSIRFSTVTSYWQRPCTDCCKIDEKVMEINANVKDAGAGQH